MTVHAVAEAVTFTIAATTGLVAALVAAAAAPAAAVTLTVRGPEASGRITVNATTTGDRTNVTIAGFLVVRARSSLRITPCADTRCHRTSRRRAVVRAVPLGERNIGLRLRVRRTRALRAELRSGRRLIARRIVVAGVEPTGSGGRRRPEPAPGPAAAPASVADAPPRPAVTLHTVPELVPRFDPAIADYAIRCTGTEDVALDAAVPAGASLTVDGVTAAGTADVHRTIALQAGQSIRFAIDDAAGTHRHVARCVPADFPSWTTEAAGAAHSPWLLFAPSLGPGASGYAIIADAHGIPVWWLKPPAGVPVDAKLLPDGSIAWARYGGSGGFSATSYDRFSLAGEPLAPVTAVGIDADHHELQVLAGGDRLLLAYRERPHVDLSGLGGPADATVIDGEVQQVTPAGQLVWSWSTRDHVAPAEAESFGLDKTLVQTPNGPAYDLTHLNSIADDGDGVVVSARHLNAIMRIRRSDGAIDWKLGGTPRAESLAFVDDPDGGASFGGQHDARILADGTLTLFDNATGRDRPPRAVRYRIDAAARTATLLERVTDARAALSRCCNSARRLPSGRWVVTNDVRRTVSELTPSGSPVLTLTFAAGFTYRAIPLAGDAVSREALQAAMDMMHPR